MMVMMIERTIRCDKMDNGRQGVGTVLGGVGKSGKGTLDFLPEEHA